MRAFEHISAKSFEEASELLRGGNAEAMAGGTDLINVYKHAILDGHPDTVVDIKRIPDSAGIEVSDGKVKVKALTKLSDISASAAVPKALSEAAHSVATPLIRNVGTIGGNICQDVRCWYYRYPHEVGGRMDCARKGGDTCFAVNGENRYHSIFGGMKVHATPCSSQCPAGTNIPAYMEQIRLGNWDEAARIIMQVNPMPMCTSRICPHPCQDKCNQCGYGESVAVHCVERTLGDYILRNAGRFYVKPEHETGKKITIIGAGPGGLTAAYYLRSAGHDVTVIDVHEKAGGVLTYGIPHYRLPKDIVDAFAAALEGMGIRFRLGTAVGKDVTVDELLAANDKLYFSTGAWKQPILGLQGESLTEFGLDFLVEVNSFLKTAIDNDVLVCGGGNVAMDVALTAKRLGAKNVSLVFRKRKDQLSASAEEIARAEEEGVIFNESWGLKRVITDEHGKVTGLETKKCVTVYNDDGSYRQEYDEDDTHVFKATTIILATGQKVDMSFLGDKLGAQIKNARGLFEVDSETNRTPNEKIYAGGDAVTGPNIAIRAIAAAGRAAKAMSSELGAPITFESRREGFLTFDADGVKKTENAKLKERSTAERSLTAEDSASLTMDEAAAEAGRCMNCGCYSVNASDIANVLVALNGEIVTTEKTIPARAFFTTKLKAYDMLERGELVKAVTVPDMTGWVTGYHKDRLRDSIDFALVSLAYAYKLENGCISDISLVFGGAAPVPVKLEAVENLLRGKKPTKELAEEAGELAVKDAVPMALNAYKTAAAKALVTRLIEAM